MFWLSFFAACTRFARRRRRRKKGDFLVGTGAINMSARWAWRREVRDARDGKDRGRRSRNQRGAGFSPLQCGTVRTREPFNNFAISTLKRRKRRAPKIFAAREDSAERG